MRRLSILVVAALALGCVADGADDAASGVEANKRIVRADLERLINNGEWTAWGEFFGDSVSFNGSDMSRAGMETMGRTFGSTVKSRRC